MSFRYKIHKDTTPNFGLIAENVAKLNPNLVIYDADRKPYTVRYEAAGLQKVSVQMELNKSEPQTVLNAQ